MVGSTLYFRICSQHELSNVHFSVPDCTVKNHDETESYKIIDDHCLDPFVSTQRVGRWTDNRFTLWATSQGRQLEILKFFVFLARRPLKTVRTKCQRGHH